MPRTTDVHYQQHVMPYYRALGVGFTLRVRGPASGGMAVQHLRRHQATRLTIKITTRITMRLLRRRRATSDRCRSRWPSCPVERQSDRETERQSDSSGVVPTEDSGCARSGSSSTHLDSRSGEMHPVGPQWPRRRRHPDRPSQPSVSTASHSLGLRAPDGLTEPVRAAYWAGAGPRPLPPDRTNAAKPPVRPFPAVPDSQNRWIPGRSRGCGAHGGAPGWAPA